MNYYDLIHSESFKKWFGDWEKAFNEAGLNFRHSAWKGVSKAVNDSGMPIVLYHGTTHEWTKYSRKLGNHENDMGIGFYATNEAYDAQQNYLSQGKDLINKISYLAEHYSSTKNVSVEKAKSIIERKYKGKTEKIIEVFLNIKRPLIISMSGKVTDGTYFDFSPTIDEDEQYTDSKELIKFREAFDEVCEDFNLNQTQCGRIWSGFYENIGELYDYVSAYKLIKALKGAEWLHEYTYDDEVGSKSYEFVSQVFQKMGFDGVIYKDASEHFKGLDMPKGTKHFIAFKSTQIKLADGTNTTFNPRSTDIRFNEGGVTDTLEKTAEINNDLIINITKSPEFKSWFGDWENDPEKSSKMINEKGEPLICFHGTNQEFNVFRSDYIGAYHDEGFYGKGFYFTFQRESKNIQWAISEALYYGKRLIPVFLNVRNPFNFRNLSKYKGVDINYLGTQTMVFLYNIAKIFPYLSDNIFIEKSTWNEKEQHYDITKLPISILPELIEKYSNELKTYIIDRDGTKYVKGYVKSKIVEYDYTASGGSKGSYEDREDLNGFIDFELGKYQTEALEIIFIEKALEKYHGLRISYFVEGYMTRNPQITEAIKQNHDGIIQSENGDEVVVFEPNQIKLADGTNTTFDANNDDIRFELGGLTFKKKRETEKELAHTDVYLGEQFIGYYMPNKSKYSEVDENWNFVSKHDDYPMLKAKTKDELISKIVSINNPEINK